MNSNPTTIAPVAAPGRRLCPRFAYATLLAGILALSFTGIGTFALGRPPMTHWVLMAHVGLSPLFAIGLAMVACTWPEYSARHSSCSRGLLWLLLLAGLVVILSGVVPMTPRFGTEGQHLLYLTHRYAGIVVAVLALLHLLSLRAKRG